MNSDITHRTQAAYDQVVDVYAQTNHFNTPDFLTAPIQQLSEWVGPGGRVFDLGCGTGRDMALFESHGVSVCGGDLSGGMLSFARRQISSPLVMIDMRTLPFADAAFAGVWSCASLLHIPKAEAPTVLSEVRRVLRLDGMLILSVQEGDGEQWDGGYVEGVERFFARYQQDEMVEMLVKAGFGVESIAKESAGTKVWLRFTCVKMETL